MTYTVTPWEVSGRIDYEKLIKDFGTKEINEPVKNKILEYTKELHLLLRRNYFFSHTDLNLALKDYEDGKGFFLYTGRGPSGPMHIGHMIPLLFTKWLQEKFKVNLYIQITDDEKFLLNREREWNQIQDNAAENILDICAVGFDPNKTFIFKNSEYIKNVYPLLLNTSRRITFSTVKAVFGFVNETNIGMVGFPAYQIIPTFFEKKRCLIPAAIDQDPYWRIQRDLAEVMGFCKVSAIHSKFLPPLSGVEGKMSSSIKETTIWLDDDLKTIERKINKYAFSGGRSTIEEHRRKGGQPEIDVSFQWLSILFEEDDEKLKQIEKDYRQGKMLSGEMKKILIEKLNKFLEEHRRKKEIAKNNVDLFMYDGKLAKEMWNKTYLC
jgi:tryptophanyl-tRNA synthetase